MKRLTFFASIFASSALFTVGCASTGVQPPTIEIESTLTSPGIGAGQGVATFDNMVVLYGDSESGVVHIFKQGTDLADEPLHTIALTRDGFDQIQHPTGFAHHPEFGTFIGNTVNGKGTIFHVDLAKAITDGDLDRAIISIIDDDIAHNGTRPEFVRIGEDWFVATADYGDEMNTLRLYDPRTLAKRPRASVKGVLVHAFPSSPFVQSLEWIDEAGVLVLVQNQTAGLGYRLTFCTIDETSLNEIAVVDLDEPADELEGFAVLSDGSFVMLSSAKDSNVHIGTLVLPEMSK